MDKYPVAHIELPYTRVSSELPSSLPTPKDIAEALTIGSEGFGRTVAAVGNDYIVKHGSHVTRNEGSVLLFLEKHSNIPVPRLYAMYEADEETFLVMSRMEGQSLDSVWSSLGAEQKKSVAVQLKAVIDSMRQLQPPSYFGNISNGPLGHRFFLTPQSDPEINGPFDTEGSLNKALVKQASRIDSAQHRSLAGFLARNLSTALHSHEKSFTHADLHAGNILVVLRNDQCIVRYSITSTYNDHENH